MDSCQKKNQCMEKDDSIDVLMFAVTVFSI